MFKKDDLTIVMVRLVIPKYKSDDQTASIYQAIVDNCEDVDLSFSETSEPNDEDVIAYNTNRCIEMEEN